MRNLSQYPITTDEIIDLLNRLIEQEIAKVDPEDPPIGDMTVLLLTEAIYLLQNERRRS